MATQNGPIRELASRENADGFVRLNWNSETGEISLRVSMGSDDFNVGNVPPSEALEAFHHPYAYADWVLKTGKAFHNVA